MRLVVRTTSEPTTHVLSKDMDVKVLVDLGSNCYLIQRMERLRRGIAVRMPKDPTYTVDAYRRVLTSRKTDRRVYAPSIKRWVILPLDSLEEDDVIEVD
jgi:virulence-associated protein VagC